MPSQARVREVPYSSPASPGHCYESVLLSIGCQPTPSLGWAWPSGQKSHPRRILGSPRCRTSACSSDVSRLGLAPKALKTYLYGARNLRDSLVPFVSEDMSHVSNLRLRVQATSEKITSGVAQKPPPHIMPLRTRARPRRPSDASARRPSDTFTRRPSGTSR